MTLGSGVSRRSFMGLVSAAAVAPILTEAHFAWAQSGRRQFVANIPPDAVLINANENPLGPCDAACEAIADAAHKGGRYDYARTMELIQVFSEQEGLKPGYLAVYAGSSEPLHYTVLAFTSPAKGYVTGDPGYEAGMRAAEFSKAKISKVLLKPDHSHDVKAMVAADPNAGVLYICNPNNPTGTITAKQDIVWALQNKPKGSILLVDEAYIHLSDAENCIDLVKADQDIIILRTFSKVYGMAGIRAGFAIGRRCGYRKPQGRDGGPLAQEDHCRHSQRHLCLAGGEQLQFHSLAVELLHDRYQAGWQSRPRGNGGQECLHRPGVASVAYECSHHGRQQGRHGEIQGGIQRSNGRIINFNARHRLTPDHAALAPGLSTDGLAVSDEG
jgi:Aminotransferase class I and II